MKKALWAIIIAIILAIIAFFVYFFNNTDQEFGTIGAPIAFTLFYEEGNEAWMPIFEKQLEKWNNIHPIFSIKERIKITSSTPIINAKNDGINAVYLGTLPGFANDLAPGRSQTDDPIDGKLFGGDIAIKPHLSHSELAVGECNIGYQPPIEGVGTSFNPTFSQVALHELSHFIGLTHSSGINISNVNIVIDSDLRARDKKLWNTIAYLNFNKSQDYFDCGIFRGFKQFGAELPCPSTTPTSVTPNEQLTLNNVIVENLSNSAQTIKVTYSMFPKNSPNSNIQILGSQEYFLEAFTSKLHDVTLQSPPGDYSGEHFIKAIILKHDEDISNNEIILTKINIQNQ